MFKEIDITPDEKELKRIEKKRRRKALNDKLDDSFEQLLVELACIPIVALMIGIVSFWCIWWTT